MRSLWICCTFAAALVLPSTAVAVDLFTDDFDMDHSANWQLFASEAFGPSPDEPDPDLDDPDASVDVFFDYSTVGIPSAPNSTGGSTRGMKIQSNLVTGIFGGASVSPIGQNFTGDYTLTFDLWCNYVGDPVTGFNIREDGTNGGLGQSMMATFGVMTDGLTGVVPGVTDALWFAATADGGSSADYRAYSVEREISYQVPPDATVLDGVGQPVDSHAVYHAGSRNNTATLYSSNFGGGSPPAAQTALYPQQFGTMPDGVLGMAWHEVEISKVGDVVDWKVDGISLITVTTTNFVDPLDGGNIFFGHSDINAGSSAEPDRFDLQFTLIDNVKVATVSVPVINADFNDDTMVDAADYVIWRKNNGLGSGATQDMGDSDGDGDVDADDYTNWAATFGSTVPGSGTVLGASVPEPASLVLMAIGLAAAACRRRQRLN